MTAATKEIRALLPTWLACMAGLGVAAAVGDSTLDDRALIGVVLATVVLGAQSMGLEYTHGTLSLLLSQPIDRRRLFLIKHAVLAPMLLSVAALASFLFRDPASLPESMGSAPAYLLLLAFFGFTVVPYLTMRFRSPVAGVVFGPVPFWLWVLGRYAAVAWHGAENAVDVERLQLLIFWSGMLTVGAVAGVASFRLFLRLEAFDGRGAELRLPSWASGADAAVERTSHPLWLLVKKEIHLQQMTLGAAAFCVGMWGVARVVSIRYPDPFGLDDEFGAIAAISGACYALLIGSLASAEERRLGTLEWQVLQPLAAWKQWATKAGVAVVLALLLCVALPVALATGRLGFSPWHVGAIVLLTTGSLYVSSLCASGLGALVMSGVVIFVVIEAQSVFLTVAQLIPRSPSAGWMPVLLLLAVIAQFLWFGFANHRSADRGVRRAAPQVAWMVALVTTGVAAQVIARL